MNPYTRRPQVKRGPLGSAIHMTTKKLSPQEMADALDEAVATFATEGIVVTPQELERALMQSCGLGSRQALLEHGWTPDIIVHSVDWDSLPRGRQA